MERVPPMPHRLTGMAYLPIITLFVAVYSIIAVKYPYGSWDAWGIWNARAAHFAFSDNLRTAVDGTIRQPDYPPLLPIIIAIGWRVFGYTPLIPITLHGAIYAVILWLFRKDMLVLGIVGAVGLRYAPMQYADMLLALWLILATVHHENRTLAGIFLGLASLTKNEGLLMLAAYVIAVLIVERKVAWRTLLAALPFMAIWVGYKAWVGVPNDVIGGGNGLEHITELHRYTTVTLFLFLQFIYFAHSAMLVLFSVPFLRRTRRILTVPVVTIVCVLTGYFAIYIITPYDLMWHLSTSSDRLMLQVLPSLAYSLTACASQGTGQV